ncbi:UNVERIFIED_CONTAM: hypothetical protein Sradi_1525700 [Sesamum radiatum]|uniref:Uncharacterized protein n=1 Tax=Sesamum radiatum TaxID=300843 RepID=A0AAW2U8H0_SESRA
MESSSKEQRRSINVFEPSVTRNAGLPAGTRRGDGNDVQVLSVQGEPAGNQLAVNGWHLSLSQTNLTSLLLTMVLQAWREIPREQKM